MSRKKDWEKQIKDAEVHAAKVEQMRKMLHGSGDGQNFKVEKEVPVFGDETQYKITDNTGARTEIHIKDNGKVEARGEQTELVEHVEKGEKIQPQSIRSVSQSKIKQQAYQTIDASILTADEKSELKQRIEKHNFVKSKEKPEETVENLKTAVERKEKQENTKETVHEQSEAEKLLHLRGTKRKTPQKSAAPGLSVTTATVAKNLKNIANGGR